MDSKKHDRGAHCGYSSNSDTLSDDDDDCGIQHLEPLPLLALSHHRCDSVLLQAFNQVIARVNAQQQVLDELCDHLYVQSGDTEDDDVEDADYPTDEVDDSASTGTSDDDNGHDDDHDGASVDDRRACTPQEDGVDNLVSADEETANALVAERLLELAAFAFTPRYRRQQPPGRGNRPQ